MLCGCFEEEYSLSDLADALRESANFYVSDFQVEKALRMAIRSVALCEDLKDFREQMETHFTAGNIFFNCGLNKEALDSYNKAIEVGERIGDYNTVAWVYVYSGVLLESIGGFGEAISKTLKGKELSEKTDAFYIQSMAYANLTIQYSRIGDLDHAEKCFEKFMKFFPEISRTGSKVAKGAGVRAKAVFLAAKSQYEEAYKLFEESLELHKATVYPRLYEAITRAEYAWALGKEGRAEESNKQAEEVKKLYGELEQRLKRSEVQADLVAPKKVGVDEEYSLRLDIANVTGTPVTLVRVDGFVPPEFRVTVLPSYCKLQDVSVDLGARKLDPFRVEPIKLSLKATKAGVFNLNPRVAYVDERGKTRICMPKPVKMIVKSTHPVVGVESFAPTSGTEFEFKTEAARGAFNFLVAAFIEDYMRRRLPPEWSGWRTLMDIVKHGRMSRRMVYGDGGYHGRVISELERRGLVEIRIFPGERGRGGRIIKVRVFYEKEIVRRHVDDRVMKVGKNKEDK